MLVNWNKQVCILKILFELRTKVLSFPLEIAGYNPCVGRPKLHKWLNAVKTQTNPDYDEAHSIAYKLTLANPSAY